MLTLSWDVAGTSCARVVSRDVVLDNLRLVLRGESKHTQLGIEEEDADLEQGDLDCLHAHDGAMCFNDFGDDAEPGDHNDDDAGENDREYAEVVQPFLDAMDESEAAALACHVDGLDVAILERVQS